MRRLGKLAWWTLPSALCLALYWPGFRSWFQQDDFAWLGLELSVQSWRDLPAALFAPMAQGTIRPLSERAFFLVGQALFGTWAAPYHAAVFATQFAALALLAAVARRLTGSRLAGLLAPVFWVTSGALVLPLSWLSAWNQVLCAFFLLAAFYCLLRHIESGERRWLVGQWAAFILGLGALETMAVYPAIALAYAWCCARPYWRKTLPLVAASAAYAAAHYFLAPYRSSDPAYALHFGPSLVTTLWEYCRLALGPDGLRHVFPTLPGWVGPAGAALLAAALAGFAVWAWRRGSRAPAFGLAWFFLTLAPVLPLRDHVLAYYLAVPTVGLALTGGAAVAASRGRRRAWRRAAVALAGLYLVAGALQAGMGARAAAERSFRARTLVLGAYRARQLYPSKTIVLTGVDNDLFWSTIGNYPFRAFGVSEVYLEPGAETRIQERPGLSRVSDFVLPASLLRAALESGRVVVYEVEPRRLRGITLSYLKRARELWGRGDPQRVDVGNSLFSQQLGPTWYRPEGGRRWMPQLASVRLAGPRNPAARLYLEGWCPSEQLRQGPLGLNVAVGGVPLPDAVVLRAPGRFQTSLRLPPELLGRTSVEVVIAVERTYRVPGDQRDLGLVFGAFEIRP
ncbi:MAG: hypothetical protein ABSD56_02335 [Bryobacteraceae bacterium]